MTKVGVTVSIPDPAKFSDVVEKAKDKGLNVSNAFEKLGVATGSIDRKLISGLKSVKGVGSVEIEREYRPAE